MKISEDHRGGWIRALPPMRPGAPASKGSLEVRAYKGRPFYEARWRDINRAQHRKRLGPAWVELDTQGNWVPKRGRVREGHLDKRRAYPLMAQVIESTKRDSSGRLPNGAMPSSRRLRPLGSSTSRPRSGSSPRRS